MDAVIRAGGSQTTVREGEVIQVNRMKGDVGSEIVFDQVLFLHGDKGFTLGKPGIDNASVLGEIVSHFRGPKLRVYKFKRRKGFSKTRGHRSEYTKIRIKEIRHSA